MRLHRIMVVILAILASSVVDVGVAQAKPPALTYRQIAALPLSQQTAILAPLRVVANAAGNVGRSQLAAIYSGLQIDASVGTVTIYLTDLGRKAEFLTAVHKTNRTADLGRVRFARGRYTRAALTATSNALIQQKDPAIEGTAVPSDGTALQVRAFDVEQARQAFMRPSLGAAKVIGSLPVVVEPARRTRDWSRLRDSPEWISGAAISQMSTAEVNGYTCTSGLAAQRNSDGLPFIMTAAHCDADNAQVYTGWQNSGRNKIGIVISRDNLDDAIAIYTGRTGQSASREWDGPPGGPYSVNPVTGYAFSYQGDMTCQDGYSSGIVCGLQVTNDSVMWTGSNGVAHRGVEAHQVNGRPAGGPGDSGGLVFACSTNCASREARGQVSAGNGPYIDWVEAPYIFNALAMRMAAP